MSGWGIRLGPKTRRLVLVVCCTVTLSGLLWIGLGWGLDPQNFAHPLSGWRHRLLVLHGTAAYVLLWVIGILFTPHQQGNWRAGRSRASGLSLAGALLLLAISGLTLYYPPHIDWRDDFSLFHQVLGVAIAVLVPLHVWAGKKFRRARHKAAPTSSKKATRTSTTTL